MVYIYKVRMKTPGGFIAGVMKFEIATGMLTGGNALDLAILFDVAESHCKNLFIKVLIDWIIKLNNGNIKMEGYLDGEYAMKWVAIGFSQHSNGVL